MKLRQVALGGMCSFLVAGCGAPGGADETSLEHGNQDQGPSKERVAAAGEAITVSGVSYYCSKVWPQTNGWMFHYGDADPCADSAGGSVQRAGMYSTWGQNHVVVSCDPGLVKPFHGAGSAPLDAAYQWAANNQSSGGCVFSVAPASLPIFGWPFLDFPALGPVTHLTGFDFARVPYNMLDVSTFGQPGSASATIVDFQGRDRSAGFIDDHDAQDWIMPRGLPLLAPADGQVLSAGFWSGSYKKGVDCCDFSAQNSCANANMPDCGDEGEIILRHVVAAPNGNGMYDEWFATGFFHLQSIVPAVLANCSVPPPHGNGTGDCSPGITVHKGDIIGYAGNRADPGGSSAPHLHFAVWRLTNTARNFTVTGFRRDNAVNSPGSVGPTVIVDPYGWSSPAGDDPWGYKALYPNALQNWPGGGALSINLWSSTPTVGGW